MIKMVAKYVYAIENVTKIINISKKMVEKREVTMRKEENGEERK